VLRHPAISATAAAGLLLVLAIPTLHLHTESPGTETLPQNLSVIKTYNKVQTAFPGGPIPAIVIVSADDVTSPEVRDAITDLQKRTGASPLFKEPVTTVVNPDRTVAEVDIPLAGDGSNSASNQALTTLRNDLVPPSRGTSTTR
jgi:RND superfamily putative drug exporter